MFLSTDANEISRDQALGGRTRIKTNDLIRVRRSELRASMTEDLRIAYDLDSVPKGANCAIIIRHADRDGGLNQVVHEDERLNEFGIGRSERLGKLLEPFSELRSFSSPVGRCKETCLHISKGYGAVVEPVATELLGMSAPFMVDPKQAYMKMREVGLLGFVDLYVRGSLDKGIALPCSEGTTMLFSYVINNIRSMTGGVGVFITHDMIITPPMAYYFGYDFKGKGLVPFLDGVVMYEEGDSYIARYAGKEISVDGLGIPKR
jgi:hypothetical protein